MEPTLQQIFGASATQDATTVTITKSEIGVLGASATGEAVLTGIVLTSQANLTQANYELNTDQSIVVTRGFSGFVNRGEPAVQYRTDELTISLSKVDDGVTLDANDY